MSQSHGLSWGVTNSPHELWGSASPGRGERVTRTTGHRSWTDLLLGAGWVLLRSAVFVLPLLQKDASKIFHCMKTQSGTWALSIRRDLYFMGIDFNTLILQMTLKGRPHLCFIQGADR